MIDIILAGSPNAPFSTLIALLNKELPLRNLSLLHFFVGIKVCKRVTSYLVQVHYSSGGHGLVCARNRPEILRPKVQSLFQRPKKLELLVRNRSWQET